MTKMEQADLLFSKDGFWRQIVPMTLGQGVFYVGIAYFSIGKGQAAQSVAGWWALVFCFIAIVYFLRYWSAAKKHQELKIDFGDRYAELVEGEKILINSNSVLLLGSPNSFARRYLPYPERSPP